MLVPCDLCDTRFELQWLQGVCVVVRKDLCSGLHSVKNIFFKWNCIPSRNILEHGKISN